MNDWNEIKAWRKARRAELIAARVAFSPEQHKAWSGRITEALERGFNVPAGAVVGFCWPYRHEFDSRFAVRHWRDQGAIAALPEVVGKSSPLQFRKWWPGAPTKPGVYDIPVPDGTEIVKPDVAIVPMNGFDGEGYRLGYGGGYFDRTLAALDRKVLAVGVAFEALRLPTIHPQAHDIPMDFVVTEAGIYRAGGRALQPMEPSAAAAEAEARMAERGLSRSRSALHAAMAQAGDGYSSPACYAHEIAPDYFGEPDSMPDEEVVALLNSLLEAERAGAKVLAAFLDEYERETPAWRQLASVQRDEARNCSILMELIARLHGLPSGATGEFLGKALAVSGKAARLEFLNRGQAWVARKIAEALPRLRRDDIRNALAAMRESHLFNIEACDALAETLRA